MNTQITTPMVATKPRKKASDSRMRSTRVPPLENMHWRRGKLFLTMTILWTDVLGKFSFFFQFKQARKRVRAKLKNQKSKPYVDNDQGFS